MSKLFSLFHKEPFHLPDFSERAAALRNLLPTFGTHRQVEALIDVSKVWTYDYDERRDLMQELFNSLPKQVQTSLIDFLTKCLPGREISEDIPLALSQVKKEKLAEFATEIA